jgi:hypothetical protein
MVKSLFFLSKQQGWSLDAAMEQLVGDAMRNLLDVGR